MALNIIKNYLTRNLCYQRNVKRKPIGIQLHTIGTGQGTAQAVADYWNQPSVEACTTYIVDCDTEGKVLQLLPEDTRSWADAGYGNNNLISFEICESDYIRYTGGANYTVLNEEKFKADIMRGYRTAVLLCANICKRYGWNPTDKLPSGLHRISSHDEGRRAGLSSGHVDPTHIWPRFGLTMDEFRADVKKAMDGETGAAIDTENEKWYRVRKTWEDAGSQMGAYRVLENAKNDCPAGYTVYDWDGKAVYKNETEASGTQVSEFENLSETQAANRLLEICRSIAESFSLLPSVCAAQTILESGYCTTELSKKANNVCGMKCSLSGNTWTGSSWDGKSKVNIRTPEQDANGNTYYIYADFRKYPCIEDSIKDRCAYLLGAKNGSNLRYAGIKECRDYREQITLIKNGGYATDVKYIDKICDIIKRFDLARFDKMAEENKEPEKEQETKEVWYRVRLAWGKTMEGQIEAYHDLNKAKEKADQNPGYKVFDENGKVLYPEENETILSKMAGYQKQFDKDKKDGKKWTYKTSGHSKRFTDAVKDNNRVLNCSLLVQWALRDLGLLDNSRFWGKVHGTLTFRETSKEQILKHFDLIDVAGKKTVNQLIKSGNLKPGDIVSYWDVLHMNIYAGNNKWYDGGHANCSGQGEGAVFKTWFGTVPYGSSKVGCILRRKNQTTDKKDNIVQAGLYDIKDNADKMCDRIKKLGFDAIVKKVNGKHRVQCGVFDEKENAVKLINALKQHGIDAILKFE